jgi:hydrogenase maturation protease
MTGRLLIAGVGNIFLSDDGFGVEVARRLATEPLPDWVQVTDYGIRGMHLAYDLASGYDAAILVDATKRGGQPGTVYVIEPELPARQSGPPDMASLGSNPMFNAHGMQPDVVFGMLTMLAEKDKDLLVVGCEPATVDYGMGLSEPVAAAVDEAVKVVLELVAVSALNSKGQADTREWSHVPRHTG